MKKEKEWLKDEVKSLFDEAYDSGKMEYYESEESIHRINSLVDQLDEPEVLSLDWIDDNKKDSGVHSIGYYVPIGKLHDLLVPKQDKPVVPKFVADWIVRRKGDFKNGFDAARYLMEYGWDDESSFEFKIYEWIKGKERIFIEAFDDGYEVEKEKKYYVLDSEDIPLLERANNQTCKTTTALSIYEDGRDNSRFALTEKEIKDYDPRFWQFAEPVEEEAE